MGNGLYDLLGWGVLRPPRLEGSFEDDSWQQAEDFEVILSALGLRSSYETEPDYLVLPLAVSLPILQDWWKLPPLPPSTPRVTPRTARVMGMPPDIILDLARQRGVDLVAIWHHAQAHYRAVGLVLPRARVIVLNDWD